MSQDMVTQIWFKHRSGSKKIVPGLKSHPNLSPKLSEVTERTADGKEYQVLKQDMDYICKITLMNDQINTDLSEQEKKLPERIQEKILEAKASTAHFAMQTNEGIRNALKEYERSGDIEVVEWKKEIDLNSKEAKGSVIFELSAIALADMKDRGIEVPTDLRKDLIESKSTAAVESPPVAQTAPRAPKPRAN